MNIPGYFVLVNKFKMFLLKIDTIFLAKKISSEYIINNYRHNNKSRYIVLLLKSGRNNSLDSEILRN